MRFTKAHGAGNDFVVLEDWGDDLEVSPSFVRALCDRHLGVGGDGILRIVRGADNVAFMDHRNADGSEAEMCGNGVRVVAKYAVDRGLVVPENGEILVATRAGDRRVALEMGERGKVRAATVDMGSPEFEPALVPVEAEGDDAIDITLDVDGRAVALSAVSLGNPHAVLVVDDVTAAPVVTLGPALESHAAFPQHTNVEFVQVVSRAEAFVRVWERGVGETASCGTGACAVLVALQRLGEAGDEVVLRFPGGDLRARYVPSERPTVLLTGPAVEVAQGELDPDWLAQVTSAPAPTPQTAAAT